MDTTPILTLLPLSFYAAAAVLAGLAVEAVIKRTLIASLLDLTVYFTIGLWYFADIFIDPEAYRALDKHALFIA